MVENCLVCSEKIETLGCGLTREEVAELRKISSSLDLKKKTVFISEGQAQDYLYQIYSGVAGLFNYLPTGKRIMIEILFEGDFIGPVPEANYPFSGKALTPLSLCRFRKTEMNALLVRTPALQKKLSMFQENALNKSRQHLMAIVHKSPVERVACFLMYLGQKMDRAEGGFTVPMGRSEIADYLGLASETVSRILADFARNEMISLGAPSQIILLQFENLAALACGSKNPEEYPFPAG